MTGATTRLRNLARGGGTYHQHRLEIVRNLLDTSDDDVQLSDFLRDRLLKLVPGQFQIFNFGNKDWDLCDRLMLSDARRIEKAMLSLVGLFVEANKESVARLYALNRVISGRLLGEVEEDFVPGADDIDPVDTQSLFSIRIECAVNAAASDVMRDRLEARFPSKSWPRLRLIYPLLHYFVNRPRQSNFDNFLSYMVTGREHEAEKLVIKLLLSDEAARTTPLVFQAYVGLMGHAYDACEFILDHVEQVVATGRRPDQNLTALLTRIDAAVPGTRAGRIIRMLSGGPAWRESPDPSELTSHLPLTEQEAAHYASLTALTPVGWTEKADADRAHAIMANMRVQQYPDPLQFQLVVANQSTWFFTDGARMLSAMLRSIYMIDREDRDLEVRDAIRLIQFWGCVTPMIAASASGMQAVRSLGLLVAQEVDDAIEKKTDAALASRARAEDRLWIVELQWTLRKLEEAGRIDDWLRHVREQTKLRPAFLTGINFKWVDEIVSQRRLRPFRSFDGAYLFLLSAIEAHGDALRLRLVLEPLLEGLDYDQVVEKVIDEFGTTAPAIIRNYMTTQNVLSSGLAANYVAALDQRVTALEKCIRRFNYGPLLTEEIYESETRTLTAELLLTSVNSGKFEIPWETFRNDAVASQSDLYVTVQSLKSISEEDPRQSAMVETVIQFTNGRNQPYRYRVRQSALFALVTAILETFMQHPAFGLEVILSGRFRHNNLLHELWSAIAGVTTATIASVGAHVKSELIEEYKSATEQVLEAWSSSFLQSRRPQRPEGLFDLIPDQAQMEGLLAATQDIETMPAIVDVLIDWLKGQLRQQVEAARLKFADEVPTLVSDAFERIKERQAERADLRLQDVELVHAAVDGTTRRRIDDLRTWFDGVDATGNTEITMDALLAAAATLFENVIRDRTITVNIDPGLSQVTFAPDEVKLAFDLLREALTNALRHGEGAIVPLRVERIEIGDLTAVDFSNPVSSDAVHDVSPVKVAGSRFTSKNDALFREGGTGLAKVAALAATLSGRDVEIECHVKGGRHVLRVPVRAVSPTSGLLPSQELAA